MIFDNNFAVWSNNSSRPKESRDCRSRDCDNQRGFTRKATRYLSFNPKFQVELGIQLNSEYSSNLFVSILYAIIALYCLSDLTELRCYGF